MRHSPPRSGDAGADTGGWLVLAGLILTVELVPWLVQTLAVPDWNAWYASLARPEWTPPRWIFPVVWPALYLLMAIAAWLVWRHAGRSGARAALLLFGIQFAVNASWTWIFGGLKDLAFAFWWILLLLPLIAATMLLFARQSRLAAWLLAPYLAWSAFAAVLSWSVWRLNPAAG